MLSTLKIGAATARSSRLLRSISTKATEHVLIVGGGIGGLCLAQGLKKHGIPFTVYERDPSPDHRLQGYRLRVTGDGYDALDAALPSDLVDTFLQSNAAFENGFAFYDAVTGEKAAHQTPPLADRAARPPPSAATPRAFATDRATLRTILRARLTPEELHYNTSFKKFSVLPNDTGVQIEFDNGDTAQGTLLVGADGTNSRVRKQYLPGRRLLDTDGRAIFGKTLLTPEFETKFPKVALGRTALTTDPNRKLSLFSEPMRFTHSTSSTAIELPKIADYMYWVLISRSKAFGSNVDNLTPEQLKELNLRVTEGWSPAIREVFERQELGIGALLKISTMHPTIENWSPTRVTLIGDAVHAMPPAGIGANTALQDTHVLLKCMLSDGVGVKAVAAYEAKMREYASKSIATSLGSGEKMFGQPPLKEMKTI